MSTKKRFWTILLAALLILNTVLATGIIAWATAEEKNVLHIDYCNLSFQDSVCIKYYVRDMKDADVKLLIWDKPQEAYTKGSEATILDPAGTTTVSGESYIVFEYDSLVAKQMADVVYARAYVEVKGEPVYGNVNKYSILQYAYSKLGKLDAEAGSESLQEMLVDMLEYGASAQIYFDYNVDRLVNADFYQVKLTAGTLADGFAHGLYLPGDKVEITAPAVDAVGSAFSYWQDSKGTVIATTAAYTLTVGNKNEVYTPVYGKDAPDLTAPFIHLDFSTDTVKDGFVKNLADNGLDAKITGNPTIVDGPEGKKAMQFGAGTVFDFLTIKNDDRLNFTTKDEYTFDFWYKLDSDAKGWDNLFSKGLQGLGWYGMWLGTSDSASGGVCWGGVVGNHYVASVNSKEVWHHVTAVQKDGMIYLYLDGKLANTVVPADYTSDTDFYIGGRNSCAVDEADSSFNAQFDGCIADFKVYHYATIDPATVLEEAPILHLDFETENIVDGVVKNTVGGGLDARITGSPAYVSGPTGGNALHFGAGNTPDYLTIKNDDRLNFTTSDQFTIDFWYKLDKGSMGWDNIFSKGLQNNGWYGVWVGQNDNSNQGVCWGGDTGNKKIGLLSAQETWFHVTIIQKFGTITMYLDGEKVNSVAAKDGTSATDFFIGGMNSATSSMAQFTGCIDDFKVYDYAVTLKPSGIMTAKSDSYTYTDAEGKSITLPYRVYYPTDYNASADKEYPILLFLHGHGECGTDNAKQLQVLNKSNKLLDDLVKMNNCIILAPQTYCDGATNVSEWVASGTGTSYRHVWDAAAGGMKAREGALEDITYTLGLQAASALLDEYLKLETVDKNRVYIGGISMGGCGTWELIARRPDTFAAAIPVCGSGITSTADKLTDIAIWAFHGTADTTVYPEGSENICNAIKKAGGDVTYTTFSGVGHNVWDSAYSAKNEAGQTPAQWLLEQSKVK